MVISNITFQHTRVWQGRPSLGFRRVSLCPPMAAPLILLGPRFPLRCGYRLGNDRVQDEWHVFCVSCCPCHRWLGLGVECVSGALSITYPHIISVLTKKETEAQAFPLPSGETVGYKCWPEHRSTWATNKNTTVIADPCWVTSSIISSPVTG